MRLKVIEAPDDAEQLYYNFDQARPEYLRWVDVDTLPDAPEKRVIELPADMIADLNEYKRARETFNLFITTVGNSIPYFEYGLRLEDLADWYLHPELVEFMPKKEPKFYVRATLNGIEGYVETSGNELTGFPLGIELATQMREAEADATVAGLGGETGLLHARKVKVED